MYKMVQVTDKEDLRRKVQTKLYEYKRKDIRLKKKFPIQNTNCETVTLQTALEIIENLESDICTICNFPITFNYVSRLTMYHVVCANFHLTDLMKQKYTPRII
jgi:hypothetical protein